MTGAAEFTVTGALPTGTTVLEASAGTGKTFTIAALAARYVAEGHARLDELLLVTFGRAATRELRDRVRERFVGTAAALAEPATARTGDDPVHRLLAAAPDEEVAARRTRLIRALAHFDDATIATTHEFCGRMLGELGMAGDQETEATFVEDLGDLVREAAEDLYVRKYGTRTAGRPDFTLKNALEIAQQAVTHGDAVLEPVAAPAGSPADARRRFADVLRSEVEVRKRRGRLYSFDDLQTRLAIALADPRGGVAALEHLRRRYRVVLVDEFQDTDPLQWRIFHGAFDGHATLVLIGDPKQAIYAFRGADVVSYLDAAENAGAAATLGTNWRSDAALLRGLDLVFAGAALGDPKIVVRPVGSAYPERRLRGGQDTPFRLRVLPRGDLPVAKDGVSVPAAREVIAADVARDIARLLTGPARLHGVRDPGDDGWDPPSEVRPVPPGAVAVLVRTNPQSREIREALAARGIPAVLTGTSSVFGTVAANEWLTLLLALEQPHRSTRVRAAAVTSFIGTTAEELDGRGEDLVVELGGKLRDWSHVASTRGIAALLETAANTERLTERLLAWADGERRLTDLRHIGQALHAAAVSGRLGLSAITEWLRRRMEEAATETDQERSRRLETDAAAVQVVTVHRAKGLEFPVVYVPFGWDRSAPPSDVLLLHDDAGRRVLDVGGDTRDADRRARGARARREEVDEELRLLYVALTRAQCQVVAWWAPGSRAKTAPLHRVLFGRQGAGLPPRDTAPVLQDGASWQALAAIAEPGVLDVERVGDDDDGSPVTWLPRQREESRGLDAARFGRTLDTSWRRTSYSSLTAGAHAQHGGGVGSEPEDPLRDDEPEVAAGPEVAPTAPGETPAGDLPSPMADLPADAAFGTLVHALLERSDATAPDLGAELLAASTIELALNPDPRLLPGPLAEALLPSLRTPLGPLAGGLRLCDIAPRDRLAELDFEFPLTGGDRPGRTPRALTLGDLAPVLQAHLAPDDPMLPYAAALEAPALAGESLRGYLNGSIDVVLRLPGDRYAVVDYKTNWLGGFTALGAEPLTTRPYRPESLATAMIAANYPLQALVYTVALHRFLRWRQAGYDPELHLGGVLYLFLRGMCGPATPAVGGVPCGVFSWLPPAPLVVALSDLLDRGVR